MPIKETLNPVLLSKFVLWIGVVVGATVMLQRRKVTSRVRLWFIVGGVGVFGLLYGLLARGGLNPNPVFSVRNLLSTLLVNHQLLIPVVAMLLILLAMVLVSNKSICGWGCQLGLLQDLFHRVQLPKWNPPFWLSNTVRIISFGVLVAGLAAAGFDWIAVVDPFRLFSFNFSWSIGLFSGMLLVASLFTYRPWCRFLCPFGLLGWLVEQKSLLRPRIDREECRECEVCIAACPSGAMEDFYNERPFHADCFACGACIEACPRGDALGWRRSSELQKGGR